MRKRFGLTFPIVGAVDSPISSRPPLITSAAARRGHRGSSRAKRLGVDVPLIAKTKCRPHQLSANENYCDESGSEIAEKLVSRQVAESESDGPKGGQEFQEITAFHV